MAARVLGGTRAALVATVACVVLFDIAALPVRSALEYDDLQAFYRTDQVLMARPAVAVGGDAGSMRLTLLAQPVFGGAQPTYGVAAEINGATLSWNCTFARGLQRLELPLPGDLLQNGIADVQLHLTGTPSREADYLLVYSSSRRGGFVVDLLPSANVDPNATVCSLA